jgi:hypothetical protein
MFKTIALILACSILCMGTQVQQLLKVPVLLTHYLEHTEQDSSISFSKFLYMHYSLPDDHDGDKDKDMKLPFKHFGNYHFATAEVAQPVVIVLHSTPEYGTIVVPIHNAGYFKSRAIADIWQPPRLV